MNGVVLYHLNPRFFAILLLAPDPLVNVAQHLTDCRGVMGVADDDHVTKESSMGDPFHSDR